MASVTVKNKTPYEQYGHRTFEVTLDEATLDRVRGILGWVVGERELREGLSALYFEAGEALGYRDDPSATRGAGNGPPTIRVVEGRQADSPLEDRR